MVAVLKKGKKRVNDGSVLLPACFALCKNGSSLSLDSFQTTPPTYFTPPMTKPHGWGETFWSLAWKLFPCLHYQPLHKDPLEPEVAISISFHVEVANMVKQQGFSIC